MKSYQQAMDHTCGAACVRTVLDHFDLFVPSEKSLAYKLKATFKDGIEPERIEAYLNEVGLVARYRIARGVGELCHRVNDGWLAIVCWADWGGHYVVVFDIYRADSDYAGGSIRMADPAAMYDGRPDGWTQTSVEHLKSMWYTPGEKKKREVIYVRA